LVRHLDVDSSHIGVTGRIDAVSENRRVTRLVRKRSNLAIIDVHHRHPIVLQ
jgi:hypothetical protein